MCAYQDPVNYTLSIVNQTGQVVASIGPKVSPRFGNIEEEFNNGILKNKTYFIKLSVNHSDFEEEAVHNTTSVGWCIINIHMYSA